MSYLAPETCEAIIEWGQAHQHSSQQGTFLPDDTIDSWTFVPQPTDPDCHAISEILTDDQLTQCVPHHQSPWVMCQLVRLHPGQTQPYHVDKCGFYHRMYPHISRNHAQRTWVQISRHHPGHLLVYDNFCVYGQPQGTCITLPWRSPHCGANLAVPTDDPAAIKWSLVIDWCAGSQ